MRHHPVRALPLLATTAVLALSAAAYAQPDLPPPHKELENGRPWTYTFGWGITFLALVMVAALVVGYLVKARDFRANAKRGGSK